MSKLAKKSEKDLRRDIAIKQTALQEFRFAVAGSKTRNVREGRNLRKEIARHLSELSERLKQA